MGRRYHYYVYVIELSKDVLYEGRFKRANPDYVMGKPCVYIRITDPVRLRSIQNTVGTEPDLFDITLADRNPSEPMCICNIQIVAGIVPNIDKDSVNWVGPRIDYLDSHFERRAARG
jgi:hypothetical protein